MSRVYPSVKIASGKSLFGTIRCPVNRAIEQIDRVQVSDSIIKRVDFRSLELLLFKILSVIVKALDRVIALISCVKNLANSVNG